MHSLLCVLIALLMVSLASSANGAERHTPSPYRSGRSVVIAPHGMVATSHPLAAQVGLEVLRRGGNAVDAAIATNAALGLMEPMNCGIGGDLFAIIWDAKTKKLHGLNASGRAPGRATIDYFRSAGFASVPLTGPLSWSVPGCVDGWDQMRRQFGTWSFKELLEPTIHYAEQGVPVPEVIARAWKSAERCDDHEFRRVYLLPPGRAPRVGEVFKNPALARVYRLIAEQGRDAFYKGDIAKRLVAFSEKKGGLFTLEDFASHTSDWVSPVMTNYRGYEVWQLPPPGQGLAVLQMLNLLEPHDLAKYGPNSADYWHLFVEAKKLVYADRAKFYADPTMAQVPLKELISKEYAAARGKQIDLAKASEDVLPGDSKLKHADTVYICVVDKDRNCVSLIQSIYFGFGSGLAPGDLGFAIQNRGNLFNLDPEHANALKPGKRPFHTIIPGFVTKAGKPWLVFGVMGGDMQPQGQVQVLVNLIDFGMNIQAAGESPRIEHVGSPTPRGEAGLAQGGIVRAERGISEEIVTELRRRGHRVEWVDRNGGGYQGILIDPSTGMLHGASEPRKDGAAVGY